MAVVRSVSLPFVQVEYDRAPASREGDATTRAGSVGVSFTHQSSAVWQIDRNTYEGEFPAGVLVTGGTDLVWHQWSEISEVIEFRLHDAWLERISGLRGVADLSGPRVAFQDLVLYSVASAFCRAMASNTVDSLRFEVLAIAAARRLTHTPLLIDRPPRIVPLDDHRLRLVEDYVEAHIDRGITLEELAGITATSVFHFAKRFKAATGTSPCAYVVGCRMNRAMQWLRRYHWPVDRVARAVGYIQVGHFRRQFVAHWGQFPGRLQG